MGVRLIQRRYMRIDPQPIAIGAFDTRGQGSYIGTQGLKGLVMFLDEGVFHPFIYQDPEGSCCGCVVGRIANMQHAMRESPNRLSNPLPVVSMIVR